MDSLLPKPRFCPHRKSRTALATCALVAGLAACSSEEGISEQSKDNDLDALKAMPYLEFSLETDPSKRGVTLWDQNRAWAGVNLYVSGKEALLLAMDGRKLHSWPLPEGHDRCEYFELLDDGDMVIVCYGTGLLRLDWSSRVVWEAETTAHHDVHSIGNRLLVPVREEPRRRWRRQVIFDSLVTLDAATGVRLDRWSTWESLDALRHLSERSGLETPLPLWRSFSRTRWDYFHLNTIEVLGDTELGRSDARFQQGNWLVCLRNTDLIVILDRDTREVVWHWGPGVVGRPHMPSQLANGNLLVYDNRSQGKSSRVVEVDPVRQEIVWQYQADPPEAFYSKLQGSSQRLPNGNTLICESEKGRAFEVTPEGEIVWEFFNPDVRNGKRRAVYRVTRMSEERVRELAELARERREG